MDWGLLERNQTENTLLREEIVYPYKVGLTRAVSTSMTYNYLDASFVKVAFVGLNS